MWLSLVMVKMVLRFGLLSLDSSSQEMVWRKGVWR